MTQPPYILDDQFGYVLRKANQRYLAIFAEVIPQLTVMQWAAIARLAQTGPLSQNLLGRETAMDATTIKGVVERLMRQGLVSTTPDPADRRRLTVSLTDAGHVLHAEIVPKAEAVTLAALGPLSGDEADLLRGLLLRLT